MRAECLADALDCRDVAHGVLGGRIPNERRELLRQQVASALVGQAA